MIKIAPSILSADFSKMGEEIEKIKSADLIHCDVMDGIFVPNITFGPKMVKDVKKIASLPLDVHLMITKPERYLDYFIDSGADYLVIHLESTDKASECLHRIKSKGVKCGMAISPDTPVGEIKPYLKDLDLALLMSVYPGFSGQKFLPKSLEKLAELKQMRDEINKNCLIEVDGGVGDDNINILYNLGADIVVTGNAVFGHEDPASRIEKLKKLIINN